MFKNKKVVVAGSLKFSKKIEKIVSVLKEDGANVIDYARNDGRDYLVVLNEFYTAIENTDILLVANEEKNGISGYIGYSAFFEINYAIINNLLHNKKIDIYLLNTPDINNTCYNEIKYFLDNNIVKLLNEEYKNKFNVKGVI